jgi:endo-1,3(4)-beta-glucanase
LYAFSPIRLSHRLSEITFEAFSGIIRTLLPDSRPKNEAVCDRFSSCYPVSDVAVFREPFCVEYKFEKDCNVTDLSDFKYKSIDGELVSIVGDSWLLKTVLVYVIGNQAKV